jgi:restriction endonuclease S subunit
MEEENYELEVLALYHTWSPDELVVCFSRGNYAYEKNYLSISKNSSKIQFDNINYYYMFIWDIPTRFNGDMFVFHETTTNVEYRISKEQGRSLWKVLIKDGWRRPTFDLPKGDAK